MWENVSQNACLCDQGFFQFDKEFEYAQYLTNEKYIMREIVAHTFTTNGVRCGPWRRKGESYAIDKEDQLRQSECIKQKEDENESKINLDTVDAGEVENDADDDDSVEAQS